MNTKVEEPLPVTENLPAEIGLWDAERIWQLRRAFGISQAILAQIVGTRQQTITSWEKKEFAPKRRYRAKLDAAEKILLDILAETKKDFFKFHEKLNSLYYFKKPSSFKHKYTREEKLHALRERKKGELASSWKRARAIQARREAALARRFGPKPSTEQHLSGDSECSGSGTEGGDPAAQKPRRL